jgi:hypothetical protein
VSVQPKTFAKVFAVTGATGRAVAVLNIEPLGPEFGGRST